MTSEIVSNALIILIHLVILKTKKKSSSVFKQKRIATAEGVLTTEAIKSKLFVTAYHLLQFWHVFKEDSLNAYWG